MVNDCHASITAKNSDNCDSYPNHRNFNFIIFSRILERKAGESS